MPVFYSQTIDDSTKMAVWRIEENEDFFLDKVPVSREITHPMKRLQHLAGRYLLQYLFPDFPLRLIQIAHTRKPYLPEESHHFSISHCGEYAAAIVSTTRRVGIDVEQPTERILRVMKKFLNEREKQLIVPHHTDQLVCMVTVLWSAKEAMYKWYSHGEIDFRRHLHIHQIAFAGDSSGAIHALFARHHPIPLLLPFRYWPDLVLSWVSV